MSDDWSEKICRAVAARIQKARANAQLTQSVLASKMGLSRAAVANIETARQDVTVTTLYRIAQICGVDPSVLLPDPKELVSELSGQEKLEISSLKGELRSGELSEENQAIILRRLYNQSK